MKINKMTYYALQIIRCIYSYQSIGENINSTTIAEKEQITNGMVVKVLNILRINNIVVSHRGVRGGYTLCVDISSISILRIVEIMQGDLECNPNLDRENDISYQDMNVIQRQLEQINDILKNVLEEFTLNRIFTQEY